jgi:hypothetical protein
VDVLAGVADRVCSLAAVAEDYRRTSCLGIRPSN